MAQEASVFRRLSVEDNIKAVLEMTDLKKDEQAARCEALIEEFRLQKVRKSLGIQLSGGERRRTEIARAVAINPAFITDRTYLLFEGKILKAGSAEELAADPMVRKVYLGQHFELRRSPTLDKLRKGQPANAAEEKPSEEKPSEEK
mgnify:CR=1 FL=1